MNQQSARHLNTMTTQMATPTNVYKVNNNSDLQQNVVNMTNYPVQLGSDDPEDRKFALQQKLVGANGVVDGIGIAQAGPDYFNYINRKMDMTSEVEYRNWLIKQANFDTPESTEYWYNMFPWIKELKESEIERVSNLQKQQAKINLVGPSSPEDWLLQYNLARGIVVIPEQPVHLLPKETSYNKNDYYTRGMFSPMVNFIPPFKNQAAVPSFKYDWKDPSTRTQNTLGNPGNLKIPPNITDYGRYRGE